MKTQLQKSIESKIKVLSLCSEIDTKLKEVQKYFKSIGI